MKWSVDMITYCENGKFAYFNNNRYCKDERTGYYRCSKTRTNLHRDIYKFHKGEISNEYSVHHVDHDKSNNSIENLCSMERNKHMQLHNEEKSKNEEWLKKARKNLDENVRPKANIWHGSEEGRKWHKEHYEKFKHKFYVLQKYKCEYCETEFETYKSNNRFCSNKCKSAWRRKEGIDNELKICEYCKKEFMANKYKKQECCSRTCSNKLKPRLPQLKV
jgi:hypothetical protein